ncbi:MAG: hypothetical protein ACKVWR_13875 [Acidimicrobiales bacterium]
MVTVTVEAWAPEYGAVQAGGLLAPASAPARLDVEAAPEAWAPRRPVGPSRAPGPIAFVDGVRRIEARVQLAVEGEVRQGVCASFAAGAVLTGPGGARLAFARMGRGLFTPFTAFDGLATAHGSFLRRAAAGDDEQALSFAVQDAMIELEVAAAAEAALLDAELVVVDGPLRGAGQPARAIGYIKTHHTSYLPAAAARVVTALAAGERTPLFAIGGRAARWSWYLRLPTPGRPVGWTGVVRCEAAASLELVEAVTLADASAAGLGRFASAPHKDPRAPQNLYPIGGLERELRRRLGDPVLLHRALLAGAARLA